MKGLYMAEDAHKLYEDLIARVKKASLLGSCNAILGWDERTYMPRGGVEHRSNQTALISGMVHEMFTTPEIGEMLSKLEDSELMNDELSAEAVNIRELRREYDKRTKLPKDLVEAISRETTKGQSIWGEARAKQDFSIFKDQLAKVFELNFQMAEAYGYEDTPYDALLDDI